MLKKILPVFVLATLVLNSCEEYFYSPQALVVETKDGFIDWIDYRSAALGLYSLQQDLVEQIIVLGELRGDLLKTNDNADPDLVEIQNFKISSTNKYAQANNFYRLISACNALIRVLEQNHPEVLEDNPPVNNYHRIYGEALCMRGWAYFNAARIYGRIPYLPEELTNYKDVEEYIMNPGATFYIDSGRYVYDINGLDIIDVSDTIYFPQDTVYIDTVNFETYARRFVDLQTVVDRVSYDLTERLNYVGVNHGQLDGLDDDSWQAIIWTEYSMNYLLGQMLMEVGNINDAYELYFKPLLTNVDYIETGSSYIRFGLDDVFSNSRWSNIHTGININEHIYTIWFGKRYQQTHVLQNLFDNSMGNFYYLKPTRKATDLWETEWRGQVPGPNSLWNSALRELNEIDEIGEPGDYFRGYGVSYIYKKGDRILSQDEVKKMLFYKSLRQEVDQMNIMHGIDTLVYKYTLGKSNFANDAHVILYRAASVHLYAAEIFIYSAFYDASSGKEKYRASRSPRYLDGRYLNPIEKDRMGVRGRVGLYTPEIDRDVIVLQDPYTNEIIGYRDLTKESGSLFNLKQEYFEEVILDERGKELAFEGERFYDIMRIAKRRNDPAFLANMIADASGKHTSDQRETIRAHLMDPNNWYVPFYLTYVE